MVVNPEVVARAHFVEMGATGAGGADPAVARLNNAISEKALSTDHPSRVVAEGPINNDVLVSLIDANTQTRNAAGGMDELNPNLRARLTVTAEKLTKIQKGEAADLTILVSDPVIKSALESLIIQNPDLASVYRGLGTDAERKAYRLKLLQNPNTKTEIARLLNENAGLDKLITDDVESLRIEGERLTQERATLNAEKTAEETKLTTSQNEIQEYQTRVDATTIPPTMIPGSFVTELATLQSEAEPLRQDVEILNRQIKLLEEQRTAATEGRVSILTSTRAMTGMTPAERLLDLKTMTAELDRKIQAKQFSLRDTTKNLQERDSKIAAIEARKKALEESITNATTRIAEIDTKLAENGPKFAENQSKLHAAETKRKLDENSFASSIESILTQAVESTINKSMDALVTEQIGIETKARDNAKTEQERLLRENIMGMYRNAVGNIDWNAFRGGWSQFLLSGSDAMLEAHLAAHPVPGLTMDQLRANSVLYTAIISDLNVKMGRLRMSQPREGMLNGIRTRLLGPQPLSEIEIRGVVDRLGDDFFDKMLTSNSKLKDQIANAAGQNMVEGHRFSQFLRKLPLKSIGLILMILLGGGLLGAGRT